MKGNQYGEFGIEKSEYLMSRIALPLSRRISKYYDLTVEGGEHIPADGPALLCPKHSACTDVPLMANALDDAGRQGYYFMRSKGFGIADSFLKRCGGIRIDRSEDGWKSITERTEELIREGEIITSFPEGGIVQPEMGQLKAGIIKMILKVQEKTGIKVPLIPVGITYGDYSSIYWPKPPAKMSVGKPIEADPRMIENDEFGLFLQNLGHEIGRLSGLEYNH